METNGRCMFYMKRSFIAISVATIIGLSACSTKVSSSTSMNSPISTSVTSEQEFLSNLENASTSQILQKLKESDGGYTEDCFSVLTNRLIKFPQDTLYVLKYDKLMNDKDFQQLVLSGIKTELPYSGSDEERNTIYQYLESITTDKEYGQIASDILGEQAENKEKPNRQIEFQPEKSGQASSVISIELPQGWKIQKREQTQRADNKPLVLASLNPSYPVYDIYDKNHELVGAVGYSTYEPYEGDRDSVQIVYSALRLGSVYRFDTDNKYNVIQSTEHGTTALTTVIFQDGASSEPVNNLGILAYDNEKECFVAIELESSSVSESQALEIAKSIRF